MADNKKDWRTHLFTILNNPTIIRSMDLSWHSSRVVTPHYHEFYQLDYFYKGYGTVMIADRSYPVVPGDLFIANPSDEHAFEAAEAKPMEGLTLKFQFLGQSASPIFPNYTANLALLSKNQQWELEHILRRAYSEALDPRDASHQLGAAFLSVFFLLLLRYLEDAEQLSESGTEADCMQRAVEYIKRYYYRPISLADLARMAGLHPQYFCHKFAEKVGISPMAALTRERIEAAKTLLTSTRFSIMEVGIHVGYQNAYHFSARFKEIVGVSPKQYRKEHST